LRPVPIGVTGELYIGGAGLARGYLGRPGLTAARFLPDPFGEPGSRMYRSGDLARRLPDGGTAFVGRADDQVKVRGFRVELGEVESVLQQVPGVRAAAVRLVGDTLVGYLTGEATVDDVAAALRQRLPDHMIPSRWVTLERLPLTVNGKVDRRVLPEPTQEAAVGYEAPRDDREAQLALIWAEVLRREKVGVHDDFFALGGHSLLATRLVHTVNQRMSAQLSLRTLFQHPVLADLAACLTTGESGAAGVFPQIVPDPAGRYEPFPLTDIQQAYWVGRQSTIDLGGVGAHAYREIALRDFDEERFTAALNRLIARHDMLRVIFHQDGSQQVLATVPEYRMPRQDLRGLDEPAVRQRLGDVRDRMSHQLFDVGRWPLFEFALTLLDDGVRLHVSTDALVVDAASSQILERELVRLYTDPDAALSPLPLCFRDYVRAELALRETPRYEKALHYWRERAGDLAPGPGLPLVRRPETVDRPRFTRYDHVLPADQWSALQQTGRQHGLTPSVVLLTAFAQVLSLWSRQQRFTLSLPLFNRLPLHPAVNQVIGDFTSLVLLEVDLRAGAGFLAQARAVQDRLWQDIDHSAVSGVRVNRMASQDQGSSRTAVPVVFNSTLSELSSDVDDRSLAAALGGEAVHTITQTPQVWIDHTVLEAEGRLHFNWDSIDELFPEGMVAEMFGTYRALLDRLTDPASWESDLDSLVPAARLEPPPPDVPARQPLMHELFDRRAVATPDAPAVLAPDRNLTYGVLRSEARRLAGRLRECGVRRGHLVAVIMERGWEQVVGTLATLYAGGAYLPIDPDSPAERVSQLLGRSGARVALLRPGQPVPLPDGIEHVVVRPEPDGPELVATGLSDTDLAYVIYTSGSTGTPKGVAIDHRGAVNTLLDINERFAVGTGDRVLGISSLSFDLSVYDIFGTLAAGAAVVILSPEPARDPAHWLDLMRAHRVTIWNSVPALLGMLVEYAEQGHEPPATLRLAMLSGDWIPVALPGRLRRLLPSARVDSLGGATEASIWSIHFPIGEVDPAWRSIPYGKPLRHQRFHVLDDAMRPRPVWVPGQLYIGGAGLAQGYWRDEATTAAAFVAHPVTGERLYRTGDLGRWLPGGTIEFLGREDGQVKVNGYRVELGEIEATLETHPDVSSAVVRLLGTEQGGKSLAAYVVARYEDGTTLAQYLARKLPDYMVPSSFTFLDALPLSANGKLDTRRLPAPAPQAEPDGGERVAEGPDEIRLVEIVGEVLQRDGIAPRTNLMRLGATSIDIVRISNALAAELGFRPKLARLMRDPTVADLLGMYREHREPAPPATVVVEDRVVEDPEARQRFKALGRGDRDFGQDAVAVALEAPGDPFFLRRYSDYRSVRQFATEPVPARALAHLLAYLSPHELDGAPKHLYGSAGGTYPVQTYLYVKPGRVTGVPGGAYYYEAAGHQLIVLGEGRMLDPDAYEYFVNRPVFDAAAFAVFLVAELAAIEPLYGAQSAAFCQIEAGAIGQLLTMMAPAHGLGLCGIGTVDTAYVEPLFELGPTHRLVYSMVGGARAPEMEDIEI
jgi:amino acid adenylation domain-containing protein